MKAIIIAAGPSTRLMPLTQNTPKCMLEIKGKPIIQNAIEIFRKNKINDISVVRGYLKEKINFNNITYFENKDFWNNNILHSLMCARPKLEEAVKSKEDVVVSYSDIFFKNSVVKSLVKDKHEIAAVVDTEWQDYYSGRTDHPISEAEMVLADKNKKIIKIGKGRVPVNSKGTKSEFIGMWKFTPKGITLFLKHFDRLNSSLKKNEPYQNAKEWQKSYITDMFQEMVDKGENIHCVLIKKNWFEFDTVQDYKRISKLA